MLRSKNLIFLFFAGLIAGVLILRLIQVQIVDGSRFVKLAQANRVFSQPIIAPRGVMLDRYGRPLVINQANYYELADPNQLFSQKKPISRQEAMQMIASRSASIDFDLDREYLFAESLAHVLGYVGPVTKEDLEMDDQLSAQDKVGKFGLELTWEKFLRGIDGQQIWEVDALGQKKRQIGEVAPQSGKNIPTSLDPQLADVALQSMGDNKGAVVVMDVDTGQVLAMVSTPTFNSNIMTKKYLDPHLEKQRREAVNNYISNPNQVFFNRAISGSYPPGSVFKLVTALAGLESGAIDPLKTVLDEGVLTTGDYSYSNWLFTQRGKVDGEISLIRAIARSNDIYFYKAAEWTGPDQIAEVARSVGLGSITGIELAGERGGLIPTPEWKEKVIGERWFLGNTYHMGIGQGDVAVTPIQVASLLQALGNQGSLCQPTLSNNENEQLDHIGNSLECKELGVTAEHLDFVLEGMLDACSSGGTASVFFENNQERRDKSKSPNQQIEDGAVACKTGTAEWGPADEKGYRKTHGWLAAIVGIDHNMTLAVADKEKFPRKLAIVVVVESDESKPFKEGSTDAAPVVKAIIDWIYQAER